MKKYIAFFSVILFSCASEDLQQGDIVAARTSTCTLTVSNPFNVSSVTFGDGMNGCWYDPSSPCFPFSLRMALESEIAPVPLNSNRVQITTFGSYGDTEHFENIISVSGTETYISSSKANVVYAYLACKYKQILTSLNLTNPLPSGCFYVIEFTSFDIGNCLCGGWHPRLDTNYKVYIYNYN